MSHFTVLCIFPNKPEDTERAVTEALDPYNEQTEVPRYRKKCYCVGNAAETEIRKTYTEPAIEAARLTFKEPDYDKKKYMIFPPKHVQRAWEEHIAPILADAKTLLEKHAQFEKPAPDCDECKGKGKVWSTYNPRGHWDWWAIGGRWENHLNGKDECPLSELIDEIAKEKDDEGKTDNFTFALCIDGDWYAAGEMLMFATVKDQDYDFGAKYIKLCQDFLKENKDAYCVMVDCHS